MTENSIVSNKEEFKRSSQASKTDFAKTADKISQSSNRLRIDFPSRCIPNIYKMCLIAGTVVIDEFTLRINHIPYILTHWHSDHYQGIYNAWSHGPIFASRVTRQLLLTKYPKLQDNVQVLPLKQWVSICQAPQIRVFALDSNHMAGSIMVLLCIERRYFLHTGDMRFNRKIAQNTPQLFQKTQKGYKSNFDIEQLHLDNTFCDPIFKFPSRSKGIRMIIELVKETKPKRVFVCTDSVGKEQAFILLSRHFKLKIAVSCNRMSYLQAMNIDWQNYFTLDLSQTWIEVISKSEKQGKIMQVGGSIAITLTGWANLTHPYPDGERSYLVPYSLHSNFREMEQLVSWIRPRQLIGVVRDAGRWEKMAKGNNYKGYMFSLMGIKQRGMEYFRDEYCQSGVQGSEKQNKTTQMDQGRGRPRTEIYH